MVLDASAVLAYLHGEPGASTVRGYLANAVISTLNWSEILQKMLARGADIEGMSDEIRDIGVDIAEFTAEDAEAAALLWRRGRSLSLADRACLALAQRLSTQALTADRAWAELDLGVEVQLIR
jgi:PIN domain nuclease of toxin-antitoxin system